MTPHNLILIVDDEIEIAHLLADALEDKGYRVVCAVNGASLAIALRQQPALILLDMMMPHMNGREVARRLRADSATAAIPIVVMSAYRQDSPHGEGVVCNAWLDKPFDLSDLYAVVERYAPLP